MPGYVTKEAVKQAMRSQPRGVLFTEWELDRVPTVDAVEVVHGQWDDFSDDRHHWKRMDLRCSICHKRASSFVGGSEDWWDSYKPNYCPNCGAKMDGDPK